MWREEGGGFRMGNTCIPVADSFWYLAKLIQFVKFKNKIKTGKKKKKKAWLVWSPCCPRDFQESSPAPQFEGVSSLGFCLLYSPALTTTRDYWEDQNLDHMDLVSRVMSLLFNTRSRFVIPFLPRSNCLLISWLQSASTVILEPQKRKSATTSTFSPSICHEVMELDYMILVF